MRITGLSNSITTLGGSISETEIVKKILQVVQEVTGRLRNVEQRKKNTISAVDEEGRLLLTEEEWLARLKLRDDTGEINGPIQCSYCGKRGHLSKNCWSKLRNKETAEKAHVVIDDGITAPVSIEPEEELPKR